MRSIAALLTLIPGAIAILDSRRKRAQKLRDEARVRSMIPLSVFRRIQSDPEMIKMILRERVLFDSMIFGYPVELFDWKELSEDAALPQVRMTRWAPHRGLSTRGHWIIDVSGAKISLRRSADDHLWRFEAIHYDDALWFAFDPSPKRLGLTPEWITESGADLAATKTRSELIGVAASAWLRTHQT